MPNLVIEDATKAEAKARVALDGPSGSGKTWTALSLALAWGGTFGVIDTERKSASKYAVNPKTGKGPFGPFKRLDMDRYDPRDLVTALAMAADAGWDTAIVDTLSKFWNGDGGMLQLVDAAGRRSYGGNKFSGWKDAAPIETQMLEAMLSFPGHLIVTMRVKTEWILVENDKGKQQPQRVGMAPVQRDGIEYEFDVVGNMDLSNTLTIEKTRCPELTGQVINRPGRDMAATILEWLGEGGETMTARDYFEIATDPQASADMLRQAYRDAKAAGCLGASFIYDSESMTLDTILHLTGARAAAREQAEAALAEAAQFGEVVDIGAQAGAR